MTIGKENFLRSRLIPLLQRINPDRSPQWGKMSFHQMVEHMVDVVKVANGHLIMNQVTPAERLPLYRDFLMSEKPFKENTKSPVLPEEPLPLRTRTIQAAIGRLQEELIDFFQAFEKNPAFKTLHPVFGELDFNENVQCLYKHSQHHLKQFGVDATLVV
jgi:hypothetical protein